MEFKHRLFWDISGRLCSEHSGVNRKVLAYEAVCIFNDLYDSNVASAQELDKRCSRPTYENLPVLLPASVQKVRGVLVAVQ